VAKFVVTRKNGEVVKKMIVLLLAQFLLYGQDSLGLEISKVIPFPELLSNSKEFDGKLIMITGVLYKDRVFQNIYDLNNRITVSSLCIKNAPVKFKKMMSKNQSKVLIFVGRFKKIHGSSRCIGEITLDGVARHEVNDHFISGPNFIMKK
jgi:hypothetical protein